VKNIKNWIPALVVMTVIFTLSSAPGDVVNSTVAKYESVQVIGHFILFMILCLAYFKATKNILLSLLLSVLYAFFDEFRQSFTLDRSSSFKDILTDTLGALISCTFLWKLLPKTPKKLKDWLLK
jgi:VanZ family protein